MIERAADVQLLYEASRKVEVKVETVRQVMRNLLEMRFTKIVQVSVQANSERCRV